MFAGLVLFVVLNSLVLFASIAVAVRARWDDRAETAVGVFVIAHALITFPTLVLGWLDLLYRPALAALVALAAGLTFALASRGQPLPAFIAAIGESFVDLCRLPIDASRKAARERHVALVGLLATVGVLLYTLWLSYLSPSVGWDGIWYHETIVGDSIQNHGFRFVEVPPSLDYVNTFPRVCEMMNLWFVIFTDRRFIEMVNAAMTPALVAAFYTMAHRFEPNKLRAAAWAVCMFWIPGVILELDSTYIDTHIAAIYMAAWALSTRPVMRLRDGAVAAIALALLSGTKGHALTWIPFIVAVAGTRLIRQNCRRNPGGVFAILGLGIAMVALAAAPTYVRNWRIYKNPVYPIAVDLANLHIRLPGHQRLEDLARPILQVIGEAFTIEIPGSEHVDIRSHGYGYGLPWVAFPLAVVGFLAACVAAVRLRLTGRSPALVDNLLVTTLPLLLTAPISPALWSARYNVHVAAALVLLAVWAVSQRGLGLFGDGPVAACLVLSFVFMIWAVPGWPTRFEDARHMAEVPAVERASFSWVGTWINHDFALHRELDLAPGDVVVFTDSYLFPGVLWNERYSNVVTYVHPSDDADFLSRLDELHAKWVTTFAGRPGYHALASSKTWEDMGLISKNSEQWHWFRRK